MKKALFDETSNGDTLTLSTNAETLLKVTAKGSDWLKVKIVKLRHSVLNQKDGVNEYKIKSDVFDKACYRKI
jgi:hypothetical protein